MFLRFNIKVIPKPMHHIICPKFIMMPRREYKMSWRILQSMKKSFFILLCPTIIIIYISSIIWRVTINKVTSLCMLYRFQESLIMKFPLSLTYYILSSSDLITNFCNIKPEQNDLASYKTGCSIHHAY